MDRHLFIAVTTTPVSHLQQHDRQQHRFENFHILCKFVSIIRSTYRAPVVDPYSRVILASMSQHLCTYYMARENGDKLKDHLFLDPVFVGLLKGGKRKEFCRG